MAKQVIVFAGLHEAGGAPIQQACAGNRRLLLKANLLYPTFFLNGRSTENHSRALHLMFGGASRGRGYAEADAPGRAIGNRIKEVLSRKLLGQSRDIVMVADDVSGLAVEELSDMNRWFGERDCLLRVICYVRRLSESVSARVAQRVMSRHSTIAAAVREILESGGALRPRIARLRRIFPAAEFYSHEVVSSHRLGAGGFFLEAIGIDSPEGTTGSEVTDPQSDSATRLMSAINEAIGPRSGNGGIDPEIVREHLAELMAIPGEEFFLRSEEVAPLWPRLAEENEWLKKTLGEDFYDRDFAFGDDPHAWPPEFVVRLKGIASGAPPALRSVLSSSLARIESVDRKAHEHLRRDPEPPASVRLEAVSARHDRALAEAHIHRGKLLQKMRRRAEALDSFDRAIALRPDHAYAFLNRGAVLGEMLRPEESLSSIERAIVLRPGYPAAYAHRARLNTDLGRFDEALQDYERAITEKPHVAAYLGRALLLQHLRRFEESSSDFDRAIELKPDRGDAYWGKADLKLLLGEYEEGWRLHEWRWKSNGYRSQFRKLSKPAWLGEHSLADKTLLVHAEAGVGDAIQFCRYVPLLQAKKIVLEVPSALIALMSTLEADVTVTEKGKPLPQFDFHCPMLSLAFAFRTTVNRIPATVPYLYADPVRQRRWRERLGAKTRPRVGLAWSGLVRGIDRTPLRRRYCELRMLAPMLELPLEFHSLQKDVRSEDQEMLAEFGQIRTHQSELNDFAETAALIQEMDLVISVDTSLAHLAGALGRPLWVLLAYATDYRWMLDRTDSPWYPTATLFRQTAIGDWAGVISRVTRQLEEQLLKVEAGSIGVPMAAPEEEIAQPRATTQPARR